jgi:hypothetical protein
MPRRLCSSVGTRLATALSQRLTNSEATEHTARLRPAARRRPSPRRLPRPRRGSARARTGASRSPPRRRRWLPRWPAALGSARNLDEDIRPIGASVQRLGCRQRAGRVVASFGETSSKAQPSIPLVAALIGRKRSAAAVMSSSARSKNKLLAGPARRELLADGSVVIVALGDRVVKDRGVRGEPGDRELVDVTLQRAVGQHGPRDVCPAGCSGRARAAAGLASWLLAPFPSGTAAAPPVFRRGDDPAASSSIRANTARPEPRPMVMPGSILARAAATAAARAGSSRSPPIPLQAQVRQVVADTRAAHHGVLPDTRREAQRVQPSQRGQRAPGRPSAFRLASGHLGRRRGTGRCRTTAAGGEP